MIRLRRWPGSCPGRNIFDLRLTIWKHNDPALNGIYVFAYGFCGRGRIMPHRWARGGGSAALSGRRMHDDRRRQERTRLLQIGTGFVIVGSVAQRLLESAKGRRRLLLENQKNNAKVVVRDGRSRHSLHLG